ncbi:MAG: SAM-dependent methyltransferase [Pseudomonadota bacterium]
MTGRGLAGLFAGLAADPTLRARFLETTERVLEDYDLSDDQRRRLIEGGDVMAGLLAEAHAETMVAAAPAAAGGQGVGAAQPKQPAPAVSGPSAAPTPEVTLPPEPEPDPLNPFAFDPDAVALAATEAALSGHGQAVTLRYLMRVMLSAETDASGQAALSPVAMLDMLSDDMRPEELAPPAMDKALLPGQRLSDARVVVSLQPHLSGEPGAYAVDWQIAATPIHRRVASTPATADHKIAPFAGGVHAAGADRERRADALATLVAALDTGPIAPGEPPPHPPPAAARPDITIAGLGLRGLDHVTAETEAAIRAAREVLYLDPGLGTAEWLAARCDRATPLFETTYAEDAHRLDGYRDVVRRVLEAALDHAPVVYAVEGHPTVGLTSVALIQRGAAALGLSLTIQPGISALDALIAALGIDPLVEGLMMVEATDLLLRRRPLIPDMPLIVWQAGMVETALYSPRPSRPERFRRLVEMLRLAYPADHPVTVFNAGTHPLVADRVDTVALEALAEATDLMVPSVTLYLPPVAPRAITDRSLLEQLDDPTHLARITR